MTEPNTGHVDAFFEAAYIAKKELSTTAYTLGRGHTCWRCEHSNIPCSLDTKQDEGS